MASADPRTMLDDAPERVHWAAWVIVALGVATLVAFAVVPGVKIKQQDAAFGDVDEGAPRERVIARMGPADSETESARGDLHRYWGDEVNPALAAEDVRTVLTWRVRSFFRAVIWQVGLDAEGRAVAKHRYD